MTAPYDARVLERVRHLHVHARQITAGVFHGGYRSLRTGQAVEFADHAPYFPGDALRDLDWRVLARADRLVVKRYRAETELRAIVVLDASADLGSTPEKWETAIRLTATMLYLLHLEGEPVGLVIGAGEGAAVRVFPPRGGRAHLARMFLSLAALQPAGRAGLDTLFRDVGARLPLRALVSVVGDFMEEPADWSKSLGALGRRRVDLRALQIYDAREFNLDIGPPVRLYSPETRRDRALDPDALREAFLEERDRFLEEVRRAMVAWRGTVQRVEAQAELVPIVARWMLGRG